MLKNNFGKKSPYFLPLCMWLLCIVFYGYQYFLQVSPSIITKELMQAFNADATALGNLAACYFYTYAAMQIPVGLIFDHFGARRPLIIASLLCALGCFLFAATPYFSITVIGRLLIGLGGAFAVVGSLYISSSWLPLKLFAFLLGITITIGMIGASCGQAPLAMLVNVIHWRNTMFLFTAIGLLISLSMYIVLKDLPKTNFPNNNKYGATPVNSKPTLVASIHHIVYGLKSIMGNKQIWLLATYGGLMFMPVSVFGSLWGTPFLMQKHNIINTAASSIVVMLFLGLAAGSPFLGWLSDKISRRKSIMFISACGALISLLIVIYAATSIYVDSFFLFCYGFFSGGSFVSFAATRETDTTHNSGAAMGFMNTLNMLGGAIAQPLVGAFIDWRWHGVLQDGIRYYSTFNFKIAFCTLPICLAFAVITLAFIRETFCQQA